MEDIQNALNQKCHPVEHEECGVEYEEVCADAVEARCQVRRVKRRQDSLVGCQVNCDDRFMLSLTHKVWSCSSFCSLIVCRQVVYDTVCPPAAHGPPHPPLVAAHGYAAHPGKHISFLLFRHDPHDCTLAIISILLPNSDLKLTKILQESTEFTRLEPEVCLHTEASTAGTEATTGGRGKPRLKETLNLERREVMDMGRQLTQDQAGFFVCCQ